MRTSIDGRAGWIEVIRDGVSVLAKGDADLRARLESALDSAQGDDPADVVTDELTAGGVRRTPDFAILDEVGARVLVRGDARVLLTGADGTTREILAPARGPWTDADLGEDIGGPPDEAVLSTGDRQSPAEKTPSGESQPAESALAESQPAESQPPEATAGSPGGWALPSIFGVKGAATPTPGADEPKNPQRPDLTVVPSEPTPVEEAPIIETPAPAGQELADDQPRAEAQTTNQTTDQTADDKTTDDELPSFDFLFGNTHRHRSSLRPDDEGEESEGSIDAGPVAAAGGYQAPENPTNSTLAPPTEDEDLSQEELSHEEPRDAAAPSPGLPGGLPPMPGSVPSSEQAPSEQAPSQEAAPSEEIDASAAAPVQGSPGGPARVSAARDDSTGREPGGGRPQFHDGHLVGSRVPDGARPAEDPPAPAAPDQDGMISSVPWGQGAAASPSSTPSPAPGLPGLPTPDHASSQPSDAPEDLDPDEVSSGPMVLAVRCSAGHHNAPHATRCRVCGQELPSQQPEQTPRPALGLLRLSTGDVVTLDRGVLIGRAPRASVEASGACAPHLVRIASPDNEISRNHVEIVLDGWHVLVRDLGSTNGTTIALPGSSPVRVRPGDQQTIEPGTTITLADQVSMVFEVTG